MMNNLMFHKVASLSLTNRETLIDEFIRTVRLADFNLHVDALQS